MSYLFIVVIGAVAGWIAGQYIKGSEMGMLPDIIAGAVGAARGAAAALEEFGQELAVGGLVVNDENLRHGGGLRAWGERAGVRGLRETQMKRIAKPRVA